MVICSNSYICIKSCHVPIFSCHMIKCNTSPTLVDCDIQKRSIDTKTKQKMLNPFKTDAASNIEITVSVCVLHTNPPMLIDLSQTKNTRFMTMSADDFTSLLVVLHYNYSCIILVRSLEKKKKL